MGKFTDSQFWQDLTEDNKLPQMQFETFISDKTIYKSGAIILAIVVIAIILSSILRNGSSSKSVTA